MKASNISTFWEGNLHRFSNEFVSFLKADPVTADFLINVGLPSDLSDLQDVLEINLYTDPTQIVWKNFNGLSYLIIGDDSGTALGISESEHHLYSLDIDGITGTPVCFVNRSLEKFVLFLTIFMEFKEKERDHSTNESELLRSMRKEMNEIDIGALENESTWWSQIVDEPI